MGYLVTTNAIGQIYDGPSTGMCAPYLFPSALHDFHGNGVDLVMHFHRPLFPATDLYQQDTEICSSEIQGQEVTMLCSQGKTQRKPQMAMCVLVAASPLPTTAPILHFPGCDECSLGYPTQAQRRAGL